jgi:hypothetical protein
MVTGKLRILVTQRLLGSIDGIRLDRFHRGGIYEVGAVIGSYLLALGAAEPVDDDTPATTPAPDRQLFGPVIDGKGFTVSRFPLDKAADSRRKKRKSRG